MMRILITSCLLVACGDNAEPPCDPKGSISAIRPTGCAAALIFAARDTAGLLPTQTETDRYFDRWRRTIEAEPLLELYIPQMYRRHNASSLTLYTTNPTFIASWSSGGVATGDQELDQAFTQLEAILNGPLRAQGGAYEYAGFVVDRIFNEEHLAAMLQPRATWMDDPIVLRDSDGSWTWLDSTDTGTDDATAQIDFGFGWGDCFNGCIWMHYVRAIVPPDGRATVYDLGGDPLPEGGGLSPNTKPLPQ